MTIERQQHGPIRYVDPLGARRSITAEERALLHAVNQKIAARPSLRAIIDYLYEDTQTLIPCDRLGLALVDERGEFVTSFYTRAGYTPLHIDAEYRQPLRGSSLAGVLDSGLPRIIDDLEEYLRLHPGSRSTKLLVKEGVRSSLTSPLLVEGHVVGFIFHSARRPNAYHSRHVELQTAISERLSQAVEKAWRIERLEEANRAYAQMLGFVSHELKSPVASMVTDARLLTQGYLGRLEPEQVAKIEGMARKGEYLLALVREYLDLARVEGGDLRLDSRTGVDVVKDVVAPALDVVRSQMEARHMRLVSELPDEGALLACCDATLLRIVLVNLLDNAVKYGDEGGEIRLSAGIVDATSDDPGRLRVSVFNEGPGFSPAQRNKLFRRFSRLDDPALKSRRGTGVGLYSAWRIAQLHGGVITADSKHGAWARFTLEIPATSNCATPTDAERGSDA